MGHTRPGKLKQCQGNCDNDSQCEKGLKCFQRSGFTAVPGCTGKGVNHHDYCIKPKAKPAPKLKCATGSPSNCKVTDLSTKVKGYSAGKLVRVDNGKSVKKSTESTRARLVTRSGLRATRRTGPQCT